VFESRIQLYLSVAAKGLFLGIVINME
jgi:hypothetical protein